MINSKDLEKLQPYLNGVCNMEIKEYVKGKSIVREVMLEYQNGVKKIGDLNANSFRMIELKGLTSIASYFARGKYGTTSWRGNCSGLLIKDLLEHFQPKHMIDPMCGSGTAKDVANEMGIETIALDLNPKWGGFDAYKMELPRSTSFIFWHPPYYVFPGSKMPQYSGCMWGNTRIETDGSHIHNQETFTRWLNKIQCNLYQSLRKGGRMAVLVGDSRFRGNYYSMFKEMNIVGTLENIIIKRQFNCLSNRLQYKNSFIPIEHEYLLIIKKNDECIIPCMIVKKEDADIRKSKKITWRALIQSTIESIGGKATRQQILDKIKNHPKANNNQYLQEKIRQIINQFSTEFIKYEDGRIGLVDI